MIAMHYRITLPADYDMSIIRKRIADRGHLTDGLPQLAFKAYLYADRNAPGNANGENRYAPFYLWHTAEGIKSISMRRRLCRIGGVVWPSNRSHVVSMAKRDYAANLSDATHATFASLPISDRLALDSMRDAEEANAQSDLDHGALATVSAFNPTIWTSVRFGLWRDNVSRRQGYDVYRVGYISRSSTRR